jgi:colicin import membrane protein
MSPAAATLSRTMPLRMERGKYVSLALTIAVHCALAIFLIYGIHWQTTAPEAVEVDLVRAPEPAPPIVAEIPPEPVAKPRVEPQPAPPPPAKPDIAIKTKTKPLKQEVRPKPTAADSFAEELRREEVSLDQRKAAAVAASEELARMKSVQAAQAATARNKAIAGYIDKIKAKIRGNLVLPPDLKGNPEALFDVIQLPSGEIISARLKRSSGNAALDAAIERAILKSSPLPKPEQGEFFNRALDLRFKPMDD